VGVDARKHDAIVSAVPGNLPEAVVAVLSASAMEDVPSGESLTIAAAGMTWAVRAWGSSSYDPVLLVHGIMSDAGVFWRLGPALAAAGHRVVTTDMPAHGETRPWRGRYALGDTAADVAALIRSLDLDVDTLSVLGHSWGGMVVAGLPIAGIRPRKLILLDPPCLEIDDLAALTQDPIERRWNSIEEALERLNVMHPEWSHGDVEAKARALTRFDAEAVRSILSRNGRWDSGLTLLAEPAASGVSVWYLRGEPEFGGLIPDHMLPQLAARVGDSHVLTIAAGSHAPMRTHHLEATTLAILHALAG
jgi:pimeloyl-ACP methyl ester carboxylesterase